MKVHDLQPKFLDEQCVLNSLSSAKSTFHLLSEKFERLFKMEHANPYGISHLEDLYFALAKIFENEPAFPCKLCTGKALVTIN